MSFKLPKPPRRRRFVRPPGLLTTSAAIFLSGCGTVLVIGGLLMWLNHLFPERKNDHLRTFPSPNGKLQAVLFRRTVQNADAYTTHVTILNAGEKLPDRSGKAFIAAGEPAVLIHWEDNKHLVIDDPDGTHVILRAAQVGEVMITDH